VAKTALVLGVWWFLFGGPAARRRLFFSLLRRSLSSVAPPLTKNTTTQQPTNKHKTQPNNTNNSSFPGIKFSYGPDSYYGNDVSVLEMDGQFDKLEELIYVESHLSNTSAKFYGEITQQVRFGRVLY
jgi:hypothetical protein